jgi:CheY-like chemotaxis protein
MYKRPTTILIADDEEAFRNNFVANHSDCGFSIEAISDIYSLPQKLQNTPKLPDVVVMDLYRTIASPGTIEV